jgi:hypothetical protein
MPISILDCFIAFMNMSEEALKMCIDFYNAGQMAEPAKFALDAVEACVDQDTVKLEKYQ